MERDLLLARVLFYEGILRLQVLHEVLAVFQVAVLVVAVVMGVEVGSDRWKDGFGEILLVHQEVIPSDFSAIQPVWDV